MLIKKNLFLPLNILVFIILLVFLLLSNFSYPSVSSLETKSSSTENISPLDQQIKLVFSRPMNQKSVEENFSITPNIKGNISWADDTLFFTPESSLRFDQTYIVKVATLAHDIYGKNLAKNFEGKLSTRKYYFTYLNQFQKLMMSELKENTEQQLTDDTVSDYQLSRVGTLVYTGHSEASPSAQLFEKDLSTNETRVLRPEITIAPIKLQLSDDGQHLYFELATDFGPSIWHLNLSNNRLITTKLTDNNPNFADFWLMPDGNTFLTVDGNNEFLLISTDLKTYAKVGQFSQYGGISGRGDKLVFSNLIPSSGSSLDLRIVLYSGDTREITDSDILARSPAISRDGKLISFSYSKSRTDIENHFGIRAVDLDSGKTIFDWFDKNYNVEDSLFSPDGHYLAVKTSRLNQQNSGVIVLNGGDLSGSQTYTIRFVDLDSAKLLPFTVIGTKFNWVM